MTDPVALAERSYGVAGRVISGVRDDQLDAGTPCAEWDVRMLVNHMIGGHYYFTAALHGHEMDPNGEPPDFTHDRVGQFGEASTAMIGAWREPGALDRTVTTMIGPMPGAVLVGMHTMDNLVHAWDLAHATGQSEDLDPELAAMVLAMMEQNNPPRGGGSPFDSEQAPPPDATPEQRLAAFLGRTV